MTDKEKKENTQTSLYHQCQLIRTGNINYLYIDKLTSINPFRHNVLNSKKVDLIIEWVKNNQTQFRRNILTED